MKTIVISITIPDGVAVALVQGHGPADDFENEPIPIETLEHPATEPLPPVQAFRTAATQQPTYVAPAPVSGWQAGMKHQDDHKPLRLNARGIYCPTKMRDDSWCPWRAA